MQCKVLQKGLLSVVFVETCLEVSICEDQSGLLFVFELLVNGLLLMVSTLALKALYATCLIQPLIQALFFYVLTI